MSKLHLPTCLPQGRAKLWPQPEIRIDHRPVHGPIARLKLQTDYRRADASIRLVPYDFVTLQRTVGNHTVQGIVAPRLADQRKESQLRAEHTTNITGTISQRYPPTLLSPHIVSMDVCSDLLTAVQKQADSFESVGYGVEAAGRTETITRPEQVLEEYGMACLGTSVMYMIQSYGLIPPRMSREEFEYAFTPLAPNSGGTTKTSKSDPIKVGGIEQPGAMPVDLVTKALQGTKKPMRRSTSLGPFTATEAALRGANWGGLGAKAIMRQMPRVLAAFKEQSQKKGYEFLAVHVSASGKSYTPNATDEKWTEGTTQLEAGTVGADYFKAGNTILAGVDYNYPPQPQVGHWVLIVREKEMTKVIAGQGHHLYPADDPLWGKVYVMAPLLRRVNKAVLAAADLKMDGDLKYQARSVHMLVRGNAYIRKRELRTED